MPPTRRVLIVGAVVGATGIQQGVVVAHEMAELDNPVRTHRRERPCGVEVVPDTLNQEFWSSRPHEVGNRAVEQKQATTHAVV